MLGSLLRLATLASAGAGMAAGFRRAMMRLAVLFAAAIFIALTVAVAIACFGIAIYLALAPLVGAAWGAAAAGGTLIVLAILLAVLCRFVYLRRPRPAAGADFGAPLGAAALGASIGGASIGGASMGGGSKGRGFDIKDAIGRNAVAVLLTAFIAGLILNNRR